MNCETCIRNEKNCEYPTSKQPCSEENIRKAEALNGKNFYCNHYEDMDKEKARIEDRGW